MKEWDVDITNLFSTLSRRMYSDLGLAGIRELISNSIDARKDKVSISIYIENYGNDSSILYRDNGTGISHFEGTYGVIGSGHGRDKDSIGMFGIGRLALISKIKGNDGVIKSIRNNKAQVYRVRTNGYSFLEERDDKRESGFELDFRLDDMNIDIDKLKKNITQCFTLPMHHGYCDIEINSEKLEPLINHDYQDTIIPINNNKIHIKYIQKDDGSINYCHNGILVKSDNFNGIEAWIDENYLDIKTDREGFVVNKDYKEFLSITKTKLNSLRSTKTLKKMEKVFVETLMTGFRSYIKNKNDELGQIEVPEDANIIFTDENKDFDITDYFDKPVDVNSIEVELPVVPEGYDVPLTDSPDGIEVFVENNEKTSDEGFVKEIERNGEAGKAIPDTPYNEDENGLARSEEDLTSVDDRIGERGNDNSIQDVENGFEKEDVGSENMDSGEGNMGDAEKTEENNIQNNKEKPPVVMKDFMTVDMGDEYPMIFFERDPFVIIINTSHPVTMDIIQDGKLTKYQRGILYSRLLECSEFKSLDSEISDLKKIFTSVDKSVLSFM